LKKVQSFSDILYLTQLWVRIGSSEQRVATIKCTEWRIASSEQRVATIKCTEWRRKVSRSNDTPLEKRVLIQSLEIRITHLCAIQWPKPRSYNQNYAVCGLQSTDMIIAVWRQIKEGRK
jgi:hypothetical protein